MHFQLSSLYRFQTAVTAISMYKELGTTTVELGDPGTILRRRAESHKNLAGVLLWCKEELVSKDLFSEELMKEIHACLESSESQYVLERLYKESRPFPATLKKGKLPIACIAHTSGSRRLVLHRANGPQAQQLVVSSDQSQTHDLSRSRQKAVGRIAMGQGQLLRNQHDLMGERRFSHRRCGFCQPLRKVRRQTNPALGIEQERLPR